MDRRSFLQKAMIAATGVEVAALMAKHGQAEEPKGKTIQSLWAAEPVTLNFGRPAELDCVCAGIFVNYSQRVWTEKNGNLYVFPTEPDIRGFAANVCHPANMPQYEGALAGDEHSKRPFLVTFGQIFPKVLGSVQTGSGRIEYEFTNLKFISLPLEVVTSRWTAVDAAYTSYIGDRFGRALALPMAEPYRLVDGLRGRPVVGFEADSLIVNVVHNT